MNSEQPASESVLTSRRIYRRRVVTLLVVVCAVALAEEEATSRHDRGSLARHNHKYRHRWQ